MKKTTMKLFALSFFGLLSNTLMAQNLQSGADQKRNDNLPEQQLTPSGHIRCFTNESEALLKAKYPNRATTEEFESWLAPQIEKIKADRAAGRNIQAVYNIPVVIHIIHNGDAIGTGENITNAQAISQITVMNQDYRRMTATPGGANTTGLAVDVEINFCLAQSDPNGQLTTGIVRHNIAPYSNNVANGAGGPDWETNADVQAVKAATQWNPNNYLNMWTIRPGGLPLSSGGLEGLLGYAQFPDTSGLGGLNASGGAANTDGVVAGYDAFGTIAQNDGTFMLNGTYNLGRTMTHEVGHWLGLRHIWGDNTSCSVNATDSNKDYCPDTPAASTANYNCVVVNSCAIAPGNDQVQNYMDYTNDACMDTFTNDQKTRMQAVMAVSPRRNSLNASTACQTPTPIIKFGNTTGSINENTNCNYTDVTYPIVIGKAPSANATVTFNVTGGTATQGSDYQIVNPSVAFNTAVTTTQNLTVRVFHDGLVEANETINISLVLNANGGDATLSPTEKDIVITLIDNDVAPLSTQANAIFTETFDPAQANATTLVDLDGDTYNWGLAASGTTSAAIGFTGNYAFSRSWISTPSTGLNPNNLLIFNNPIVMPATGNLNLSFAIGTTQAAPYHLEHYAVYVSTSNVPATIIAQTPVHEATLASGTSRNVINVNLNAFAGQTVYLTFRHFNTFDMNWIMLDDIIVNNAINASIQTAVNTTTAYQAILSATGTAHAKDATTGKIMLSLTDNDNFNYGCATISVSRDQTTAGAAAVNYGTNTANNLKVMAKTFTVTTANNNPSGNATYTFYFTEAEIAAWETATGNSRNALKAFKQGNSSTAATTLGAFGTAGPTLTATFTNGANGVYYFGTDGSLANVAFDLSESISVYPNPTKDILNISVPSAFGLPTSYTIFNSLGQVVKKVDTVSEKDLTISTASYSNGLYFIKIIKDGASTTKKFIKN